MALHDAGWPATLALVKGLVGVAPAAPTDWPAKPIMGVSEGEQASVPDYPWAWLLNTRDNFPDRTSADQEISEYLITIRLLTNYTNDPQNAELILMPLIEQIRNAFRAHIKMGTTTIAYGRASYADWGYIPVGDIWYRSTDIVCTITEKQSMQGAYGA